MCGTFDNTKEMSVASGTVTQLGKRKRVQSELKVFDLGFVTDDVPGHSTDPGAQAEYSFPRPAVGADFFNRIGRQIKCHTLEVSLYLQWFWTWNNLTAFYNSNALRIAVVRDIRPETNGSTPPFNFVFNQTLSNGGSNSPLLAPQNWAEKDRFEILHDKVVVFNNDSPGEDPDTTGRDGDRRHRTFVHNFTIDLGGKMTTYQSPGSTSNDFSTGAYYLFLMARQRVKDTGGTPDTYNYIQISDDSSLRVTYTE